MLFTPFVNGALDKLLLWVLAFFIAVLLGLKTQGADYLGYLDYFYEIQKSNNLYDVLHYVKDPLIYLKGMVSICAGLRP